MPATRRSNATVPRPRTFVALPFCIRVHQRLSVVLSSSILANASGAQMMVRSEIIRGRFRNSYENPEPFVPNEMAEVKLPLQDVCHTFKAGHRIMIHVQSTWFPLIDRNPQKYVDNIFKATVGDFIMATHTVFHKPEAQSWIEMKVFKP